MFARFARVTIFDLVRKANIVSILLIHTYQECRYMPRVRDRPNSYRRPHLDPTRKNHTLICYCATCDQEVEQSLPLRLSEYCDCDQYTRWICLPCRVKELDEEEYYYRTRTKGELEDLTNEDDAILYLFNQEIVWHFGHQQDRAVSERIF